MGSSTKSKVVGFVGIDDMCLELGASLVQSGYALQAFDSQLDGPLMLEFSKRLAGNICANAMEVTEGVAAIILSISHPIEIDDLVFGPLGILKGLKKDVVVILRTVKLLAEVQKLEKCLTEDYGFSAVVDAHVYKGLSEDLNGKIVLISSGKSEAIARARPVLSAMSGKLHVFKGEIGAGSKVKMVIEVLEAIHLVASIEAICLGVQAKIHPWIIYDIISNAAGNSWIFKQHVPQWLRADHMKHQTLNAIVENLGAIVGLCKSLPFPLPLLGVSHQQLLGCSHASEDSNSAPLFKVWEKVLGIKLEDAANEETYSPLELAKVLDSKAKAVNRIGFIGLGAMGFGMATHLLKSNFTVVGFDVYEPTLARFKGAGGLVASSPLEVANGVDVLVIMVTNESQAESVLYGERGAVQALSEGAAIILSSTVSPAYVSQLEQRLQGKNLKLVDAPVSGGVKRASAGTLTITCILDYNHSHGPTRDF